MTAETATMASAEGMGFGNIYDKHIDAILSFLGRKGSASFYREQVNKSLCSTCYFLANSWTFNCLIMLWRFLLNSKSRFSAKLLHSLAEIYSMDLHPARRLVTAIIHCVYQIPGARLVCMDLTRPSPLACSGWDLACKTSTSLNCLVYYL